MGKIFIIPLGYCEYLSLNANAILFSLIPQEQVSHPCIYFHFQAIFVAFFFLPDAFSPVSGERLFYLVYAVVPLVSGSVSKNN